LDIILGSRVGSRSFTTAKTESPCLDANAYEVLITNLFVPWLIEEIPDGKWATLQKELGCIVRDIISRRN